MLCLFVGFICFRIKENMKKVLLMRHAKSRQANLHQNDHDRNLSERGERDARTMAKFIKSKGVIPDIMWISDSKRTQETWKHLNDIFKNNRSKFDKELYLASSETIVSKIKGLDNMLDSVLILAHNPGITDVFSEYFNIHIDHIPTSGVGCIQFHTDKFENILECNFELEYFSYPSMINNG